MRVITSLFYVIYQLMTEENPRTIVGVEEYNNFAITRIFN